VKHFQFRIAIWNDLAKKRVELDISAGFVAKPLSFVVVQSENDKNRFILVQRHYYMGHFGTSKTHECRRVDLSKHLRAVLMAHKEGALLRAFQFGKTSIADELVFPSEEGTPICPDNIG